MQINTLLGKKKITSDESRCAWSQKCVLDNKANSALKSWRWWQKKVQHTPNGELLHATHAKQVPFTQGNIAEKCKRCRKKTAVPVCGPGAGEHSRFDPELVSGALFLLFEISAV